MDDDNRLSRVYEIPALGPEESAAVVRIEHVWGQLRYQVHEPRRWTGHVRQVFAARAIQGSNSIEGYNVSVEDAVAAINRGEPTGSSSEEAWLATESYRRAMTNVLQLAKDDHFEYSPQLLRQLHFMMTEHDMDASPGLWRGGPIWVRREATGEAVYEGPGADRVPGLAEQLVHQLDSSSELPVMVRAAMAHLNLVMIHPFRDGNGRMARCLQTLVLAREGVLAPVFCSIEEYLGRNTATYYDVLARVGGGAWNPQHDARPWVRYCLEAHYVQALSLLRRIHEAGQIWEELEEEVRVAGLPERVIEALFDASLGLVVRNSSYRKAVAENWEEVSQQVATRDLGRAVEAGLLIKRGAKRGTCYDGVPRLLEYRREKQRRRPPIETGDLFEPDLKPDPSLF